MLRARLEEVAEWMPLLRKSASATGRRPSSVAPEPLRDDVRREERFFERDQHRLWARDVMPAGGEPDGWVVFAHGNTFSSVGDFDMPTPGGSLAERLAAHGVASRLFDQLGYGRSDKPREGMLGFRSRGRDIECALADLRARRSPRHVTLAGLSSAAMSMAELIRAKRPVLDSLVFFGPNYVLTPTLAKMVARLQRLRALRGVVGRGRDPYIAFDRPTLRRRLCAGEEGSASPDYVERFISASVEDIEPGARELESPVMGYAEPGRPYPAGVLLYHASVFDQPVLVIRGERDEFCDERCARRFIRDLRSEVVEECVIPEIKHDFGLYPGGVAAVEAALLPFLESTWSRRGGATDGVDLSYLW